MSDASVEWGGDFTLTASGDLALVESDDLVQQRIIRRLCTATKAYIWHLDYGAGLPQRIGRVAVPSRIQAIVRAQIKLEATVAPTPVPRITVTEPKTNPGLFVIAIEYTDKVSGEPIDLKFEIPGS